MEAKDIDAMYDKWLNSGSVTVRDLQLESFKAGIKEVAGFIKRNLAGLASNDEEVFTKAWEMYDAKLKEWGVK